MANLVRPRSKDERPGRWHLRPQDAVARTSLRRICLLRHLQNRNFERKTKFFSSFFFVQEEAMSSRDISQWKGQIKFVRDPRTSVLEGGTFVLRTPLPGDARRRTSPEYRKTGGGV
ncbi:hypothetical protein CDAR_512211 [Caerostris darwini]|uniref:Uncharacterized protein n=1 Tax=Caerostris darwini TaxID=1538125 RepID=A0AAV4WG53_9ARAC|nr:hypothetical protein CDAR_512211 [Caerostris darwini]